MYSENNMMRIFIITAALIVISFASSLSDVINVPADYSTIQAGIDASFDGDTVLVQPGTYVENIFFGGREITVGSLFLTTGSTSFISSTIIDGDSIGPVVSFVNDEDSSSIITGFTIRNGYYTSSGGGIRCIGSNPVISYNIISDNYAYGGGGIACTNYSNPFISHNTVSNNMSYGSGVNGGGILCHWGSNATITNNIICENTSYYPWGNADGGGIGLFVSSPIISNNIIKDNIANHAGGILCRQGSNPIIDNNAIFRNSAINGSSGIYCYYDSNPIISNNVICDNFVGGIGCYWNSYPTVINTICWYNEPPQVAGEFNIIYCNIQGGWEGEGNIDLIPQFIDPDNDNYNVCAHSPCIDAGSPDIEDPDGTRSDIGVYYPFHPDCFFANVWYVSTTGNDSTGNGSPGNPFRTIQYAIDISVWHDTIIVENGIYEENILINYKKIVLGSNYIFSEDTLDIQNTIIDGDSLNTVITLEDCEDSLTVIKGFAIKNGNGPGILCINSNPTISNNIISNNFSGGIFCDDSHPLIIWNIIEENQVSGGIYCHESNPIIINNIITENIADSTGGGIYCYSSNPIINSNSLIGNSAQIGGGIYCSFSYFSICDNTINGNISENYGGGIYCYRSSVDIVNNTINSNHASNRGGGIYYDYQSQYNPRALVSNNIINNNSTDSLGGGIFYADVSLTINNNIISSNSSGWSGGGIYGYEGLHDTLSSNTIKENVSGCFGGGIYCNNSNPIIKHNIINHNYTGISGGGIYGNYSNPTIYNNVITENIADSSGGGIYCISSFVYATSSIFWGDSAGIDGNEIFADSVSFIDIIFCDIQGGWEGTGNIDIDPLFRNPDNGDFHLMAVICGDNFDSPCIDAGYHDSIDSLLDCSWGLGTILGDIGAYSGGEGTVGIINQKIEVPKQFNLSQNYPNPFNAQTTINYALVKTSNVNIEIYDILGRRVETLINREQPAGYHQAIWNADGFSSGVYFYKIQTGDYSEIKKMMLIR